MNLFKHNRPMVWVVRLAIHWNENRWMAWSMQFGEVDLPRFDDVSLVMLVLLSKIDLTLFMLVLAKLDLVTTGYADFGKVTLGTLCYSLLPTVPFVTPLYHWSKIKIIWLLTSRSTFSCSTFLFLPGSLKRKVNRQ